MKLAQTLNRLYFHKYYSYYMIVIVLVYLLLISSSCEKVHSILIINKTGKEYKIKIRRLHYIDSFSRTINEYDTGSFGARRQFYYYAKIAFDVLFHKEHLKL